MGAFADLVLRARERPVLVTDLLRAWRREGRGEQDGAVMAAVETTAAPTEDWLECLRSLEHAFAPEELAHLTATWSTERRTPRIESTEAALRERLRRAASTGGCSEP